MLSLTDSPTPGAPPTPVVPVLQPATPQRIVAIGGGTGLPAVLQGLRTVGARGRDHHPDWLTAVVTVMDDGGSSGRLRESLGVLPPGDIRNCLGALAGKPSLLSGILHDRLPGEDGQAGHPIGNLLLAALTSSEGNFLRAVTMLGSQMNITGRVLPATLESVHLRAAFEDGGDVRGETAITARGGRIRRLTLERPVKPLPEVLDSVRNADLIVVGPGSLYTSILPNLLVDGVAEAMFSATATRVYVANLMTEPGETDGFALGDHLRVLREHTAFDLFDYILVNRAPLPATAVAQYEVDGARVIPTHPGLAQDTGRARIVTADLARTTPQGQIRHQPEALAWALLALSGRPQGMHGGRQKSAAGQSSSARTSQDRQ